MDMRRAIDTQLTPAQRNALSRLEDDPGAKVVGFSERYQGPIVITGKGVTKVIPPEGRRVPMVYQLKDAA